MAQIQELVQKYWWIVAGVAFFWFWLRQHDALILARADADRRVDSVNVVLKDLKHASDMAELKRQVEFAQGEVVAAKAEAASIRAQTTGRINAATTTLRAELTERQATMLDSIVGGYQAQIVALDNVVVKMELKDSLMHVQIDSLQYVNARLLNTLETSNKLNADLAKQIRPKNALGVVAVLLTAAAIIF